ncbi:hypothetical protein FW774_11210 [Pedobacter sp. BS3]|uniref:hypothetical protein n=1 Tax=Pedobacter sp. BS3 TaxID=2567937 RepID=UPI0011EFA0ED|nr:hypothetical protein [Pedobacter sp. BS3]TZF84006.1 hypothetical protein FW774_11210 [Pedobacter sp. BS3]
MRKLFLCFLTFSLVIAINLQAQTYTEYKQGANYWGGAYVPPVWTKTYDYNLKAYNIKTPSTPSSTSYSSGSPASSPGTTYVKKSRWSFLDQEIDYEWAARQKAFRNAKAKEMAEEYGRTLNRAIEYFNKGAFIPCYNTLRVTLPKTLDKEVAENNNYDEAIQYIDQYRNTIGLYIFLSGVKYGHLSDAAYYYNTFLSKGRDYDDPAKLESDKPYPLTGKYYHCLDTTKLAIQYNFNKYLAKERFLADLYLVELFCAMGRKEEANTLFKRVLDFYIPKVEDVHPFLPQIAINHFYTGNVKEAEKLLEYYWNGTESYSARLNILNELIINHNFPEKWSRASYPEGYEFIKKNYLFIDSLVKSRNLKIFEYNEKNTYTLFAERGNDVDSYIKFAKPVFEGSLEEQYTRKGDTSVYRIDYSVFNSRVEFYLTALLKKGDIEGIKTTLQRVYDVSQKAAALIRTDEDRRIKESKDSKIGMSWWMYYSIKADPLRNALWFFDMPNFVQAGGAKYLREAAEPLLKEMSAFTEKEFSINTHFIESWGVKPKFMKSRKYPSD